MDTLLRRHSACCACCGRGVLPGRVIKRHRSLIRRRELWDVQVARGIPQLGPPPDVPEELERSQVLCIRCNGAGVLPVCANDDAAWRRAGVTLVAVVGGGIGGFALALALQQRGLRVTVYERDLSFGARAQGYGLTMQQGAAALRQLGIECDGIYSTAHFSFSPDGTVLGGYGRRLRGEQHAAATDDIATGSMGRRSRKSNFHIPRQELRKLLYSQLAPGTVKWGYRLRAYQENTDTADSSGGPHRVQLEFYNGLVKSCDVLVGADGIFSVVRTQKLGQGPESLRYLGVMVMLGIAPCNSQGTENTVNQTLDGDTRLYTMPFTCGGTGADSIQRTTMWQLSFPFPEELAVAMRGKTDLLKQEALVNIILERRSSFA